MTHEELRLEETRQKTAHWQRWGPYLSERAWGTVREDYSAYGNAWEYLSHDHARSRAYRWNEDGIAGICDRHQRICFALALWNGHDPFLKDRLFGLTGKQGNHAEDVKECYWYLDSSPTHSYMKCLYRYPQREFPYSPLVAENRRRTRDDPEYELLDTGIFSDNRFFDVYVEYAKAAPDDILIRIEVFNRGPEAAALHVLPTVWFRNTWSWTYEVARPELREWAPDTIEMEEPYYGRRWLYVAGGPELLFTNNESNRELLWGVPNWEPYVKDGICEAVVRGRHEAVNPENAGTKVAAHYELRIDPGASAVVRLRLADSLMDAPFASSFDEIFAARIREA